MRHGFRALISAQLLALPLAACGEPEPMRIDHVWVRLPAVPGRPAAAYFDLHAGPAPQTLVAVSADIALRSEMHESKSESGVMTMAAIPRVTIPAKTTIRFEPGGRHAMLFGIDPGYKPGGKTMLTFTFAGGTRMTANAPVIAAGDPAPKD
ncbi:copper chaperone PCu(A)C [Sphingomonas sp. EC-HK361]|uniref:copper chaperone PCu(A)C n=1 Tax=Sphingomonas sp. EC-HK361 TaxID=2038397 RepID=UPI00125FE45C|nr:copper chaperone PCu(A)C [Sphingomonas sp. EC-HK361]